MSALLNIGIFLGGYGVITAVTVASIWAVKREPRAPAPMSIKLPIKPRVKFSVSRLHN